MTTTMGTMPNEHVDWSSHKLAQVMRRKVSQLKSKIRVVECVRWLCVPLLTLLTMNAAAAAVSVAFC